MPEIDQAQYVAGKKSFDGGMTLASIFTHPKGMHDRGEAEDKAISFLLGFGDALLDKLRNPPVA